MIIMLAEFANLERTQIQHRMKSGYETHLANGGRVGRNKGSVKSVEDLKSENKDVIKCLN
jgi:DNA invertase Pin-like site-specific DNA recombinase